MMRTVTLSLVSCLVLVPVLLAQQECPKPAEKKSSVEDRELQIKRRIQRWATNSGAFQKELNKVGKRASKALLVKLAQGDGVREALEEVQRAVSRAQGKADLNALRKELDKAEKALMKARWELWKQIERANGKPKEVPKKATRRETATSRTFVEIFRGPF